MNKKILTICLSALLFLSFASYVSANSTAVSISVSDQKIGFSLMQRTASSFFNLTIGEFKPYQPSNAPTRVFSLLYFAAETGDPPPVIHKKHKGKGWGKTAKAYGLPSNYHGKYMSAKNKKKFSTIEIIDDQSFELMMTVRFLHEYYGVDQELLYYWHSRGMSDYDLFLTVNLSARLKISPVEIFDLRINGTDWRLVAQKYKIPYSSLGDPVSPKTAIKNTAIKNKGKIPPGQAKKGK